MCNLQPLQCGVAWLVVWVVVNIIIDGNPYPDILNGKRAWYWDVLFSNGDPTRMLQETGREIIRRAMQDAGVPAWMWHSLAHYMRHEFAVEARVCHSMPVAEVKQGGGWGHEIWAQVYSQVASGDSLANRSGFTSRLTYMVLHMLLDPSEVSEFRAMTCSLFSDAEDMLSQVQQV